MMDVNVDLLQWSINFLQWYYKSEYFEQTIREELQKPLIRKSNEAKVHSTFMGNIWRADLADMQLISKCYRGFRFLLCVIGIYSKYAQVIPLKDNKGNTFTNAFQNILDESKRKQNKL